MRRTMIVFAGLIVILTCGACRITYRQFNWDTFRFERVGPRRDRAATPPATGHAERSTVD